jgi:hypothetical protein
VSVEPPGEFGFTPCVPEFDPLCHLKKIWKKEHDYIYNDMAAVRALGGNCVTLANKMQEFFEANPPRLLFFDGPRPNLTGETSLADNHGDAIHISRQGKDPNTGEITINSNSDKARLFRHEAKHSLGWSHELMQSIGYQCDPPEGP